MVDSPTQYLRLPTSAAARCMIDVDRQAISRRNYTIGPQLDTFLWRGERGSSTDVSDHHRLPTDRRTAPDAIHISPRSTAVAMMVAVALTIAFGPGDALGARDVGCLGSDGSSTTGSFVATTGILQAALPSSNSPNLMFMGSAPREPFVRSDDAVAMRWSRCKRPRRFAR